MADGWEMMSVFLYFPTRIFLAWEKSISILCVCLIFILILECIFLTWRLQSQLFSLVWNVKLNLPDSHFGCVIQSPSDVQRERCRCRSPWDVVGQMRVVMAEEGRGDCNDAFVLAPCKSPLGVQLNSFYFSPFFFYTDVLLLGWLSSSWSS